jgi:MFS superfamily sulfate permease-like transporter
VERLRWFAPGIRSRGAYTRHDLGRDVSAGVLLSSLLIPAGMGYAVVAGLPPIAGLHATVVGLVVYAAMGLLSDALVRVV